MLLNLMPQSRQLRELLGLNPGKLKANTKQEEFEVNGVRVYLLTPQQAKERMPDAGRVSYRMWAVCPCGRHVPCAKFNQHYKSCGGAK